MSTLRELAHEFNAQPYEVAAFAGFGADYDETVDLGYDHENAIRDAWMFAEADRACDR